MAEATKTVDMSVSPAALWKTITDYERYAEFVDGMKSVEVLSRGPGTEAACPHGPGTEAACPTVRVKYNIELLGKTVSYTLDHVETAPSRMTWTLVESNVMKSNDGGWEIKELGATSCSVTYRLALDFKIFVPGMILNGLVKNMLPRMLESFERQAKNG